jgi:probable selenium-dependent hydroxylase accessory protein YqeC
MLRLASEMAEQGGRALVTTTTKIWPPAAIPVVLDAMTPGSADTLRQVSTSKHLVALAAHRSAEGKLVGVPPARVCALCRERVADLILCEADGAAGRSLKSHRAGEPVIPECATHVLVLAGLDALDQPVGSNWVHRVPEFCRVAGARDGETISPAHIARVLATAAGSAPASARVWFVLTKVRGAEREAGARAIADHLAALTHGPSVITLSSGAPDSNRTPTTP